MLTAWGTRNTPTPDSTLYLQEMEIPSSQAQSSLLITIGPLRICQGLEATKTLQPSNNNQSLYYPKEQLLENTRPLEIYKRPSYISDWKET